MPTCNCATQEKLFAKLFKRVFVLCLKKFGRNPPQPTQQTLNLQK